MRGARGSSALGGERPAILGTLTSPRPPGDKYADSHAEDPERGLLTEGGERHKGNIEDERKIFGQDTMVAKVSQVRLLSGCRGDKAKGHWSPALVPSYHYPKAVCLFTVFLTAA
jgi:hypothetical protein